MKTICTLLFGIVILSNVSFSAQKNRHPASPDDQMFDSKKAQQIEVYLSSIQQIDYEQRPEDHSLVLNIWAKATELLADNDSIRQKCQSSYCGPVEVAKGPIRIKFSREHFCRQVLERAYDTKSEFSMNVDGTGIGIVSEVKSAAASASPVGGPFAALYIDADAQVSIKCSISKKK